MFLANTTLQLGVSVAIVINILEKETSKAQKRESSRWIYSDERGVEGNIKIKILAPANLIAGKMTASIRSRRESPLEPTFGYIVKNQVLAWTISCWKIRVLRLIVKMNIVHRIQVTNNAERHKRNKQLTRFYPIYSSTICDQFDQGISDLYSGKM